MISLVSLGCFQYIPPSMTWRWRQHGAKMTWIMDRIACKMLRAAHKSSCSPVTEVTKCPIACESRPKGLCVGRANDNGGAGFQVASGEEGATEAAMGLLGSLKAPSTWLSRACCISPCTPHTSGLHIRRSTSPPQYATPTLADLQHDHKFA